jgi:hypothetical protein
MNPVGLLQAGCEILDAALQPYGFTQLPPESGPSSGGTFARTQYVREDRRLELHFRYSLGLVMYHVGGISLPHEDYMRAVVGRRGGNQYPGFSDDPLDGFRHLRHDLEHYCSAFLTGTDDDFQQVATKVATQPRVTGFKALSAE